MTIPPHQFSEHFQYSVLVAPLGDDTFQHFTFVVNGSPEVVPLFPDIPVTEDQIRHRFSGVRPLPRADGDIGMVTRDHSIAELALPGGTPVLCLIGGKWTTFRGFSEQASDRILNALDRPRQKSTEAMQIGGGKGYPAATDRGKWVADEAAAAGIPPARMERLLARYGTRAVEIAPHLGADRPLESLPDYSREELAWIVRHERVGHVDDLLCRRTTIAISGELTPETRREITALYEATSGSGPADRPRRIPDEVL